MTKRYQNILVPLDGSEIAELALDDACRLAELNQAQVTLLQVISPIEDVIGLHTDYPIYVDVQWENKRKDALQYLRRVAQRFTCSGVEVKVAAEMGPSAESIVNYADKHAIDLIVMATHGRTGLRRLVYGSVAEAVLHQANVPILLVRAHPEPVADTVPA